MDDLKIFSSDVIPVYEMKDTGEKVVIGRELHERLHITERYSKWFGRMCGYGFTEGIDYTPYQKVHPQNGQTLDDYLLRLDMAKHIAMIQRTPEGFAIRQKLIELETAVTNVIDDLSPELRLLINMERKQKEQDKAIADVQTKLDGIRDVITLSPDNWRQDVNDLLSKIATDQGGTAYDYRGIRHESYELLNTRMGVNLKTRLKRMRERMADRGATATARKNVSYLDVIAEDKKLVEGYLAIVKEMALKYGVTP